MVDWLYIHGMVQYLAQTLPCRSLHCSPTQFQLIPGISNSIHITLNQLNWPRNNVSAMVPRTSWSPISSDPPIGSIGSIPFFFLFIGSTMWSTLKAQPVSTGLHGRLALHTWDGAIPSTNTAMQVVTLLPHSISVDSRNFQFHSHNTESTELTKEQCERNGPQDVVVTNL